MLALLHAHEKGIVHRDIKPDNIFVLNQSGVRLHVRVLDFGIARIYKRDAPTTAESLTAAGAVLGTPRYMSPEQLAGQPVDARSDLYSRPPSSSFTKRSPGRCLTSVARS